MMSAPSATVFVHPNMTAAQAEHLCHAEGRPCDEPEPQYSIDAKRLLWRTLG